MVCITNLAFIIYYETIIQFVNLHYLMKIVLIKTIFFLLISLNVIAGGLEKGFEALEIHDYFKAKSLFEKSMKSQACGSSYGLSLIYAKNNNPFYSLDSALKYVKIAVDEFPKTKPAIKKKLNLLKVDSLTILKHRSYIDDQCFQRAKILNTVEAYNLFIQNNEGAFHMEEAIKNRNELAFYIAKQENKSELFESFINNYPEASQAKEAKVRYNRTLFNEYTHYNTIESNLEFIADHPESPYINKAHFNIYNIVTRPQTIKSFESFIERYPDNPYVDNAWRRIYNISTEIFTSSNIKKFLKEYPDYPFKDELKKDFLLANTKFYKMYKNGKYGFVDKEMNIRVPIIYSEANEFSEGVAAVSLNGEIGYINKIGELLIDYQFEEGGVFKNGLAMVSKDDKFGVIDKSGTFIVPLMYDDIGNISHQYISVGLNDQYGFIDRKGTLKVGLEYETVGDYSNGIAYVKKDGLFGLIDTNLYYVVKPKYEWIDDRTPHFVRIKQDGKYGAINISGEEKVEPKYDQLSELHNGYSLVVIGDQYGYIDEYGNVKVEINIPVNEGIMNWAMFNDRGFAMVMIEGKFGMIDSTGAKFMPALFEDIGGMGPKLIAIKRHGKWGYCDYNTKLRIPYNFTMAEAFVGDVAVVQTEEGFGMINRGGAFITKEFYGSIELWGNNIYKVKLGDKYGLINEKAEGVMPVEYEDIRLSDDQKFIILTKGGAYEYIKNELIK